MHVTYLPNYPYALYPQVQRSSNNHSKKLRSKHIYIGRQSGTNMRGIRYQLTCGWKCDVFVKASRFEACWGGGVGPFERFVFLLFFPKPVEGGLLSNPKPQLVQAYNYAT